MRSLVVLLGIVAAVLPLRCDGPSPMWEGLIGLYTVPTAETLPPHAVGLTFGEIRFSSSNNTQTSFNRWFSSSITVIPVNRVELALTDRHELVDFGLENVAGRTSTLNAGRAIGSVKVVLLPVKKKSIGVAIGGQDLWNNTRSLNDVDTGRGNRYFLTGTYQWLTAGATYTRQKFGTFGGGHLALTETIELIGEISSQPRFVLPVPRPGNHVNFNLGLRFYPRQVPNLRIDTALVADSRQNFGFAISYLFP